MQGDLGLPAEDMPMPPRR